MKFFLIILLSSFCFTNQISIISGGNLEKFSLMNGRSFIDNIINNDNSLLTASFIQYPEQINISEIMFNSYFKNYLIQSKIVVLNFGTFTETPPMGDVNQFKVSEKNIQLSIVDKSSSGFLFGSSIGYAWSKIDNYISKNIVHSIGCRKSLMKNRLHLGLSLENMIYAIEEFSNINQSYTAQTNIGITYIPEHLDAKLYINYLYENPTDSELIVSIKNTINDNFTIYAGKSIYLDHMSLDNQYTFYDNFSCGVNIIKSRYQYNMGIQYLGAIGIVFGSSFTVLTK